MAWQLPETHLDAWRAVLNAQAAVVGRVEQALAEADLPPLSWYDVLWPLHRAPGRSLRMRDLTDQVVILGRSGLTRLVDRLEASGMLERRPAADDGRGVEIAITRKGSNLLRRMWPVYAGVLQECVAKTIDEREARRLADMLRRIASEAGKPRPRRRVHG